MCSDDFDRQTVDRLLGPNEILIVEDIVTTEEQSVLVRWADSNLRAGRMLNNPRDPESYSTPYCSASDRALTSLTKHYGSKQEDQQKLVWIPKMSEDLVDPLPDQFWKIRTRVIQLLGLTDLAEDPYKGSFLNYIVPGGKVHQHRDDRLTLGEEEFAILRCNVLFKRPQEGGLPIISRREIDVPDRGMWAFYATELVHAASEVRGKEARGTLSFGFSIRLGRLWERRFRVAPVLLPKSANIQACRPDSLFEQLRNHSCCDQIGSERLELLRIVLSEQKEFSLRQLAEDVRQNPSEVWEVLRLLQSLGFVQSESSVRIGREKILVV
jgi:hypothetical protein